MTDKIDETGQQILNLASKCGYWAEVSVAYSGGKPEERRWYFYAGERCASPSEPMRDGEAATWLQDTLDRFSNRDSEESRAEKIRIGAIRKDLMAFSKRGPDGNRLWWFSGQWEFLKSAEAGMSDHDALAWLAQRQDLTENNEVTR
jgi:hypothetical protein